MNEPMIPIRSIGWVGQFRFSDLAFPEAWDQWVDSLSTPVSIALIVCGLLGLTFGWLIGRSKRREVAASRETDSNGRENAAPLDPPPEWVWRHEKLVLTEREDAERRDRLQELVDDLCEGEPPVDLEVRARLFGLAEQMREYRRRVGSELSRLSSVRDRLVQIREDGGPRENAVGACIEMAESQLDRLSRVRDRLRDPTIAICDLERGWAEAPHRSDPAAGADSGEFRPYGGLRNRLEQLEGPLRDLPSDLHGLTDETDRKIREILAAGGEPEFDAIRSVLLVDGAVTASRVDSGRVPVDSLRELVAMLREKSSDPPAGEAPACRAATNGALPVRPVPMRPDSGFRPPIASSEEAETTADADVDSEPAEGNDAAEAPEPPRPAPQGWVIFRSNRVGDWGRTFYRGRDRRAREVDEMPGWAEWISVRRIDTGERVLVPIENYLESTEDSQAGFGFNASHEQFYGAHHLGVFAETCPNEVETRFTYGGWGFGHRVGGLGEPDSDPQASGWAGREIDPDTVFEIALLAALPEDADESEVLSGRTPEVVDAFPGIP